MCVLIDFNIIFFEEIDFNFGVMVKVLFGLGGLVGLFVIFTGWSWLKGNKTFRNRRPEILKSFV